MNLLDINDASSYHHKYMTVNGHRYHFVDEGPPGGTPILMLHGFPELWVFFLHQIKFLSENGYRVIALDMLGYGQSDSPRELVAYSYKSIIDDLKSLITKLCIDKVILLAHDWGSMFMWYFSYQHPELVKGLISLCIPIHDPTDSASSIEELVEKVPSLSYQLSIANSDVSEMDRDVRRFLESFLAIDPRNLGLLSNIPAHSNILEFISKLKYDRTLIFDEKQMDYIVQQFQLNGTFGPTNYYRTYNINRQYTAQFSGDAKIIAPTLYIDALEDTIIVKKIVRNKNLVQNLTHKFLNGGHWIHITNHHEVNKIIIDWLRSENI